MASKSLRDLTLEASNVAAEWIHSCRLKKTEVLIYCTYRSPEEQEICYAMGRTAPGLPCRHLAVLRRVGSCPAHPMGLSVTNAKPWHSWHQFRRAWDAVPMIGGKPDWSYADSNADGTPDEPWWAAMVQAADELGIEWAGRWTGLLREFVHWQEPGGRTLAELRSELGILNV